LACTGTFIRANVCFVVLAWLLRTLLPTHTHTSEYCIPSVGGHPIWTWMLLDIFWKQQSGPMAHKKGNFRKPILSCLHVTFGASKPTFWYFNTAYVHYMLAICLNLVIYQLTSVKHCKDLSFWFLNNSITKYFDFCLICVCCCPKQKRRIASIPKVMAWNI